MTDDSFNPLANFLPAIPKPKKLSPTTRRLISFTDTEDPSILFQHSVLCQTSMPYRNPGDDVRLWERSSGKALLEIQAGRAAHPVLKRFVDIGLPFGAKPRLVLYRTDRGPRPATRLPIVPIRPSDGWCDAPADHRYNRRVRLPYPASNEALWRTDGLYDIIVVLDYNERPRRQGAGSAIFMHLARPGFAATEGCIALSPRDLHQVLRIVRPGTKIWVTG